MSSSLQEKVAHQGSSLDTTPGDSEVNRQLTEDSLRRQAHDILLLTRPDSVDEDEWEFVEEEKVKSKKKTSKKTKSKKKSKKGKSASESPKEPPTKPKRSCPATEATATSSLVAVASSAPASCDTNFNPSSSTTHISMSQSKMPRPSVSGQTFPGAERVAGMGNPSGRSVGLQEDYDVEQGVLHAPVREYSEELDATSSNAQHDDDIGKGGGQITATAVTRADLEEEVRNRLMAEVVTAQVIGVSDQPHAFDNGLSTSNVDLEKSSSEETTTSIWTKRRSMLLKLLLILLAAAIAAIVVVLLLSRHPGGEGSGYMENGNAQQQASAITTEDGDTSGISQDVPRLGDD